MALRLPHKKHSAKNPHGNIPADPKYAWLTYETLLQKIPEVAEGLQMGAKVLGSLIAKILREKKL